MHPVAAAAGAFLKTLVVEPPIKPGTPDPYVPPKPGELLSADAPADRPDHAVHHHAGQVEHDEPPDPGHGIEHQSG